MIDMLQSYIWRFMMYIRGRAARCVDQGTRPRGASSSLQANGSNLCKIHVVTNFSTMHDINGSISLTFYCGELPADAAIGAAGHEPNGYFWEGLVQYLAPELAAQVELDSEAGMFAASGDPAVLEQIRALIDPYLGDGERVATTILEAEASGFQFDD